MKNTSGLKKTSAPVTGRSKNNKSVNRGKGAEEEKKSQISKSPTPSPQLVNANQSQISASPDLTKV